MFGIKNLIIKLFNKNKIRDNLNLDDIFPYCTTIKAIKSEEKDNINLNLNFAVMNNLGVSKNKTFNNIGESKAFFDLIIKRYTKIPVSGLSINKDYTINLNEKCKDILIEIYEGKGKDLIKYKKIGEIILTGIKKAGIITYNIEFIVDIYGKLKVVLRVDENKIEKDIADLNLIIINRETKKLKLYKKKNIYNLNSMINLIKNLRQILHDSNKIKENNTINDINFKNENQNIKIKIEIDNNYKPVNNKNKNNFQDYNKFENNQTKNKNIDIFEENSNKKINESNLENDILYNQKKKEIIDNIEQKINKELNENNLQNYDYIQYNQKRNNNKEIIEENKNKEIIEEKKNKENI